MISPPKPLRDGTAIAALRISLVLIFFWFGWMKFLAFEAEGVAGIARDYWAFGWLYPLVGIAGASIVIGIIELTTGLLIAVGHWQPKVSLVGGAMGVVTFLITLSFMLVVPSVSPEGYDFPALGSTGQFLIKDIVLLAGCFLIARDGLALIRTER